MKKPGLADAVTLLRIALSPFIMATRPLSAEFFVLYTVCGLTDIADGAIARMTRCDSDRGALLDSVADMVFMVVAAVRLLPSVLKNVPAVLLYIALFSAFLRIFAYIIGAVKYRRPVFRHTPLNKIAGIAVFALPFALLLGSTAVYAAVCAVALISAADELIANLRYAEL